MEGAKKGNPVLTTTIKEERRRRRRKGERTKGEIKMTGGYKYTVL